MKNYFFVAAALFCSPQVFPQSGDSSSLMNEVTVTAAKFPKKQTETGKLITIISRDMIEKNGGGSLSDLLQTQVGLTVIGANNAPGTNQTLSVRGASSGNVLLLIDGVPANDPSVVTQYYDINFISLDAVERIEILKGGQSTLYGSDAVAGAVNIITRKAQSPKLSLEGGLTGGSFQTFRQHLGLSKKGKHAFTLNYSHLGTDGFSAANDKTGNKNFDRDGMNQHALQANAQFKLSQNTQINLLGAYQYYKADIDASAFTDDRDFTARNQSVQAAIGFVHRQPQTGGTLYFNYAFNYNQRNYLDDSIYVVPNGFSTFSKSSYVGRTHFAELYDSWKWKGWEFLLGMDYRLHNTEQNYFSTGPFGDYENHFPNARMSQASPYTSLVYKAKNGITLEAGTRLNIHSEYGSNTSFTFNPSWLIDQKFKVFANLYSAFKAPTVFQLFDALYGNPDLRPETALVTEGGFQFLGKNGFSAGLTGYYFNTRNKIEFIITDPMFFTSQYRNVSRQEQWGAEFEMNYSQNSFSGRLAYTFSDGKTISGYDGTGFPLGKDTTYFNLYRIPRHSFNVKLGYDINQNWHASIAARSVSERSEFIYGASPEKLAAYTVFDFYVQYKKDKYRIFVDARNLLDKNYTDILGYNSRPFTLMAGIAFRL